MSGKVERRVPLPAYVTVDGAKYYPEGTIESLEAERDELRAQNAALMDRICNCPHNARAEAAHHADWCDVRRALNPEEGG